MRLIEFIINFLNGLMFLPYNTHFYDRKKKTDYYFNKLAITIALKVCFLLLCSVYAHAMR